MTDAGRVAQHLLLRLHRHPEGQDPGAVRPQGRRRHAARRSTSTRCSRRSRRATSSTCCRATTTYDTAFQIAQRSKSPPQPRSKLVDESAATKGLMRWVSLHPTNIGQKVQIIVEHFRANVAHLLDGHAKAMVVTDSRKAAVRYKTAIDAYIAKQGYTHRHPGRVLRLDRGRRRGLRQGRAAVHRDQHEPRSARSDLPVAFGTDQFKIMIVANKFQTGFDQPLLCAMYVDKRLSGVTAVQTLSRLNRTYRARAGKDTTFVLDFVNKPDEILQLVRAVLPRRHHRDRNRPGHRPRPATKLDHAAHLHRRRGRRLRRRLPGAQARRHLSPAEGRSRAVQQPLQRSRPGRRQGRSRGTRPVPQGRRLVRPALRLHVPDRQLRRHRPGEALPLPAAAAPPPNRQSGR